MRRFIVSFVLGSVVPTLGCNQAARVDRPPVEPDATTQAPEPKRSSAPLTPAEIAERTLPAVVVVMAGDSYGSGFHIGKGLVATSLHVVAGQDQITIRTQDGKEYPVGAVVGYLQSEDLAILQVERLKVPNLRLQIGKVRVGDPVVAIGHPRGLESTVSTGVVSGLRESEGRQVIQFTAPISPGSSGGPIVNAQGEVIAITAFFARESQALNFGEPSRELMRIIPKKGVAPFALLEFAKLTTDQAGAAINTESQNWNQLSIRVEKLAPILRNELGEFVGHELWKVMRDIVEKQDAEALKKAEDLRATLRSERAAIERSLVDAGSFNDAGADQLGQIYLRAWERACVENDQQQAFQQARDRFLGYMAQLQQRHTIPAFPESFAGFPFMGDLKGIYEACHPGYTMYSSPGLQYAECPSAFVEPPFAHGAPALTFLDGRLVSIIMAADSYQEAVTRISEKYGKPTFGKRTKAGWVSSSTQSFALDSSFDWDLDGGRIRVTRTAKGPWVLFTRDEYDTARENSF